MKKEEKIKGLYSLKQYLSENPIELEGHKSLPITLIDYAIESLEQEPILDKIRAEIENMQIVYDKSANYKDERTDEEKANDLGKMYKVLVLNIIDKYKAEMESENA